jgi:hypothetical protein
MDQRLDRIQLLGVFGFSAAVGALVGIVILMVQVNDIRARVFALETSRPPVVIGHAAPNENGWHPGR